MGSYNQLKYIDKKLELNKSGTGIPGLMNKYLLSSKNKQLDENTVQALTTSYTNSQLIKSERNGFDIDFFKFDKNDSIWKFAYALDISNLFVDDTFLTDCNNYEIEPNDIKLVKAEFTKEQAAIDEVNQFEKPLVLQFSMDNTAKSPSLKVYLKYKIPTWVSKANVADDLGQVPSPNQTFAIGNLIEGVFEAFKSKTSSPNIFEFEIRINKYK